MPLSQHAHQTEPAPTRAIRAFASDLIDLDQVSVSQLLGRDYVFIHANALTAALANNPDSYSQLEKLVRQLELAQTHTVVVTFSQTSSGKPSFTRHDLTWYKGKICRIESLAITHQDQLEFMDMIWQCSTAAMPS